MTDIPMQIDCAACPVRDIACDGCMVTAMLAIGAGEMPLDAVEQRAVGVFANAGLISHVEAEEAIARAEPGVAAWASVS
ncbi:hypothetical protein [Demetria terragena]|uniref:hypothetical protein n=1 Tax=Demetria terragena TaxID=63959 RepID=UPI000371A8F3|nr:hypothetical protein [Demetria terragena]